jgi:hypothetical protein
MVGYWLLMEADETGTLARLKTHRLELINPAIAKNRGRLIKTIGDDDAGGKQRSGCRRDHRLDRGQGAPRRPVTCCPAAQSVY